MSNDRFAGRKRRMLLFHPMGETHKENLSPGLAALDEFDGHSGFSNSDPFTEACQTLPAVELICRDGSGQVIQQVPFSNPYLLIGSGDKCGLRLIHPDISYRHVYLQWLGGKIVGFDLDSRTGTRWPKSSRSSSWLNLGDSFMLGPYTIELYGDPEQPVPEIVVSSPMKRGIEQNQEDPPKHVVLEIDSQTRKRPPTQRYRINHNITLLGWSPLCQVQLRHESISRIHCSIVQTPNGIWVLDLLGKDGIKINGEPGSCHRLAANDQIEIGVFKIRSLFKSSISNPPAPNGLGDKDILVESVHSSGELLNEDQTGSSVVGGTELLQDQPIPAVPQVDSWFGLESEVSANPLPSPDLLQSAFAQPGLTGEPISFATSFATPLQEPASMVGKTSVSQNGEQDSGPSGSGDAVFAPQGSDLEVGSINRNQDNPTYRGNKENQPTIANQEDFPLPNQPFLGQAGMPMVLPSGMAPLPGFPQVSLPQMLSQGQSGMSEGFVVALVNQFASMQQMMFEQSYQMMQMMTQMFNSMHARQTELIRDDLRRVHELTQEIQQLHADLLRERNQAPPQNTVSASLGKKTTRKKRPEPQNSKAAEPRNVPIPPAPPPAPEAPKPKQPPCPPTGGPAGTQTHSWLTDRISALETERTSRWQKIMQSLTGGGK